MTARPAGRYVYAIVDGGGRAPRARGIGGRPLAHVRVGRVGALVEPMQHAPAVSVERLASQERLLRRLASMLPAILPARFGSFVPSDSELRRLLRGRERGFAAALRRVRGTEQMTLRLFIRAGPKAGASTIAHMEAPPVRPARANPRSGAAYLERRAAELSGGNVPALQAIRAALASRRLVRDQRIETHRAAQPAPGSAEKPLVSVYHLIPRGRSRAYCDAVFDVVSRGSGVAAVVSGPWPPYAFVPETFE